MTLDAPAYIPDEIVDKIRSTAKIEDVAKDHLELKRSGTSLLATCPICNAPKKLTITPGKSIFKCFMNGCEMHGTDAISFVMKAKGWSFQQACIWLADRYGIAIEPPEKKAKKKAGNRKEKFRDLQLKESGITDKYQKYYQPRGADKYECDRYQAASVNDRFEVDPTGDDMVLHYVNLDWTPMMWKSGKTQKGGPLLRVRYQNPSLHKSREGEPMKYQSPYDSGSHLWLPNGLIKAYEQFQTIDTLYVCEGEKKADKLTIHGMMAVAVMGIHNFAAGGDMPHIFELIIKRCGVVNVVFLLDADWQDISAKPMKPVDMRPKTFYSAVKKFRDYFAAYRLEGIELAIYFAYGKDQALKGIDDLLVRGLKGQEDKLKADFDKAQLARDGQGDIVNVHNITTISEYKLQEFWHLHSPDAFLAAHKDELVRVKEFIFQKIQRRWNEEKGEFELAQALLPHEEYWTLERDERSGKKILTFDYQQIRVFLKNRGFGRLRIVEKDSFRMVHVQGSVVREVDQHYIQDYIYNFTEQIKKWDVLRMLLRGGSQYLGPEKLSQMYYTELSFIQPEKDVQYLFFKNVYWRISADGIEQGKMSELSRHVWANQLIDFEPKYTGSPMMTADRDGDNWKLGFSDEFQKSDIALYYERSSAFHWRKVQTVAKCSDGSYTIVDREQRERITEQDKNFWMAHLMGKVLAAGYVMHDYRDYSNAKAIVAMDGEESEVGRSQGGTGKSIWGKQFKYITPFKLIDGKKKNLEDDNHLWEGVDERTKVVLFDDVRTNFPFEFLFAVITTGLTVNPKREKRFDVEPPKVIITTNHTLNGEGNSFDRRQYLISFSDYYNSARKPSDEFGRQFFHEWDHDQWNLFYNWMATCAHLYLKHGLRYEIPQEELRRRKLRQRIGETFIQWATLWFHTEQDDEGKRGRLLNCRLEKDWLFLKYVDKHPVEKRYMDERRFKEKIIAYCDYAGLKFNPQRNGDRIKSDGREYLVLADERFSAADCPAVKDDRDLEIRLAGTVQGQAPDPFASI